MPCRQFEGIVLLYCFDDFILDPGQRELRRDGNAIPLQPQVFDLLEFLIRQRDRVVTRDDLIAAIWGGRIVSDSALATRINAARAAIGDSGDEREVAKDVEMSFAPTKLETSHLVVGRAAPLATLDEMIERALAGERQVA